MTEEMQELGRRAGAAKSWRWMEGMRWVEWQPGHPYHLNTGRLDYIPGESGMEDYEIPDLSDPATVGCLLALVREAWGEPVAVWYPKSTETCCVGVGRMPVASGRFWQRRTYAASLVAALEAAP